MTAAVSSDRRSSASRAGGLRGLTSEGQLFDVALNRLHSQLGTKPPRYNDEFAGSTFSPDGDTLFVNIQAAAGMSFAIWGPWESIGV